jgi:hypothetical protein
MDGMFCVTPGVEVSLYMWVHMISIIGAWKDSTKGDNNLAKLNASQASICRRFKHWYRHMALVGDMTIEELVLFYFQKKSSEIFTILWDRARTTLPYHIILINTLGLVISICFPQSFISVYCLKIYQQIQMLIEHKDVENWFGSQSLHWEDTDYGEGVTARWRKIVTWPYCP